MALLLLRTSLLLLAAASVHLVWGLFIKNGGMDMITHAISQGEYPPATDGVKVFTGRQALDRQLMTSIGFNLVALDAAFLPGRLFFAQFLAQVSVPIFIIAVEGRRERRGKASISPTAWGLFSQQVTSALAYPLYCLAYISNTSSISPSRLGRVPARAALAALVGHVLGFAVPCLCMFDPLGHGSVEFRSLAVLAFVWFPPLVKLVDIMTGAVLKLVFKSVPSALRLAYVVLGLVAAAFHLFTIGLAWRNEGGLFNDVFVLGSSPDSSLREQVLVFFKLDYLLTFLALIIWAFYESVVVFPRSAPSLMLGFTMGSILLGPGALLSVVWYFRECELNGKSDEKKA